MAYGIDINEQVDEGARMLRAAHGGAALAECWRRLDAATAARDHPAGIHWADVAARLGDQPASDG